MSSTNSTVGQMENAAQATITSSGQVPDANAKAHALAVKMLEVHAAEMAAAEKLVKTKYPHLTIVPGSMIQEADHPVYHNKRRVTVVCGCGAHVERATSDLHTFIGCETCKKHVRKANKINKKLTLAEALAIVNAAKGSTTTGGETAGETGETKQLGREEIDAIKAAIKEDGNQPLED